MKATMKEIRKHLEILLESSSHRHSTFVGENEGNNEGDKEALGDPVGEFLSPTFDIRHSLERMKATMKEIRKHLEILLEFVSPTFDIHIRWRESRQQ